MNFSLRCGASKNQLLYWYLRPGRRWAVGVVSVRTSVG